MFARKLRIWCAVGTGFLVSAAWALPPVVEVRLQVPVYESSATIEVPAYLYRPQDNGPHPAIVDLHGCNGIWPVRSEPWIEHYLEWGVAVLQVDSFSTRGYSNICGNLFAVPTWQRALDAHAAKRWLRKQDWVDSGQVFVTGFSHGATTVLLALDDELNGPQPFAGAVAIGPWCPDSLNNTRTSLLILIGGSDQWTPAQRCRVMAPTRADQLELVVYEHVHHSFDAPGTDTIYAGYRVAHDAAATRDAVARVREFLDRHSGR